eukprot:c25017_g2_i1 orf=43-1239(+)
MSPSLNSISSLHLFLNCARSMSTLLIYCLLIWLGSMPCANSLSTDVVLRRNHTRRDSFASFVFGDSLVDVGNNNYLPFCLATAKSLPNGIDFPVPNGRTATGRFTNGLTIPDMLAQKVGLVSFPPPFLAPTSHGAAILNGVNYASGGGGILNNTGRLFVNRLSMDVQISYFEETLKELKELIGTDNTTKLVSNAIFSVTIGANDFINNYISLVPNTLDPILLRPRAFIRLLITRYAGQLRRLYNNGARKFIIVNLPLIGCAPYQRSLRVGRNGICSPRANRLAASFNKPLNRMLDQLNADLPNATFLHADAYSATLDIIDNFQDFGFEAADKACCGALGSKKGLIPCRSFVTPCPDRSKYFFWDPYHLTQAGYEILANELFDGTKYISPMNVRQLIEL